MLSLYSRRTVLETRPSRQNTGGQDQPQIAPAPQPDVVPQVQGFGGLAGAQPPAQGFLARWLGGAGAAPPIVPGQFAPGPGGFNPGAPNQAQFQPQQGFPGQNPFGPWQQPGYYVPVQQPPAPVQVLQGFYIGNQWQPWGAPPQPLHQRQVRPQGQTPAAPTPSQTPQPTPTTQGAADPGENNAQVPPQTPATPSTTSQNESSSTRESPDSNPSPREAAVLAALRRMRSQNPMPSSPTLVTPPIPVSSGGNNHQLPEGSTSSQLPASNATSQVSPAQTTPPVSGGSTSSTTGGSRPPSITTNPATRPGRPLAPSLIPLFDPATTSATIVPPPPYHRMPSQGQFPPHPSYVHPQMFSRLRPRPADVNPLTELSRRIDLPDLRTLPQTLTQEQLDRLDVTTREAIDERLRVLENVQGAVWRCVEELVRVRSTLPPQSLRNDPSSTQAQHPDHTPESSSKKVGDTPDSKGKTRAESSRSSSSSLSSSSSSTEDTPEADPALAPETTIPAALDVGSQGVVNDTPAMVTEVLEGVAEHAQ